MAAKSQKANVSEDFPVVFQQFNEDQLKLTNEKMKMPSNIRSFSTKEFQNCIESKSKTLHAACEAALAQLDVAISIENASNELKRSKIREIKLLIAQMKAAESLKQATTKESVETHTASSLDNDGHEAVDPPSKPIKNESCDNGVTKNPDPLETVNSTFCVTKPQLLPRRSVMPKLEDFHFSDDLRSQLLRDMEISGKYSSKPPPIAPSVSMTYTSKASNTPSGQLIDETQNPFGSASSLKVSPGMFGKTEAIKSPEAGRAIKPLWKVQSSKLPVSSGNSKTAPQQLPSIEEENRDSRGSLTRSGGSMNPKGSDEGSLLVTSPEEEEEMLGGVDKLHLSSLDQTTEDETRVVIPVVIPKHLIESSLRSHNNASGIKMPRMPACLTENNGQNETVDGKPQMRKSMQLFPKPPRLQTISWDSPVSPAKQNHGISLGGADSAFKSSKIPKPARRRTSAFSSDAGNITYMLHESTLADGGYRILPISHNEYTKLSSQITSKYTLDSLNNGVTKLNAWLTTKTVNDSFPGITRMDMSEILNLDGMDILCFLKALVQLDRLERSRSENDKSMYVLP